MRQALLVIVLVGAAFGGGALVSGPGFRFAQEHLLDYMGLQDGGEIDALDLAPPPDAAQAPATAAGPSEPLVGAAAVAASAPRPATPAPAPAAPAPAPKPTEPFTETQAAQAAPTPAPAAEPPAKAEPPALLGALSAMLPQAPAPGSAPAGSTRPAPEAPAPLDPGVAPSALASPEPAATPAPATGGDWAEVRRKLAAAGVGRYTIEGEPGGRVVFACLIPVAGKQAVSQRFEAEAADEFQAAQAVLKRINLWRASHPAAPESP